MQRNLALSFYLSPSEAVKWLKEHNYRTSYRAVSEMMRSGAISSIEKRDYSVHKRPRIVTTVAALEKYLEDDWKNNSTTKKNTTTQLEAASTRKILENIELAQVPTKWEQTVEETLNLNKLDSYLDTQAQKQLDESARLAELRAQRRAAKKEQQR